LDLVGDQEDSAMIAGNIRNHTEKAAPKEENETPHIKETHPESHVPQGTSIPVVNSTPPTYAISIPLQPNSQNHSVSVNTGRILGSPGVSQLGPLGFILIGIVRPTMVGHMGGSIARYPKLWGKGDEYVDQHWFLCEAI
jgi:hypothetical protein